MVVSGIKTGSNSNDAEDIVYDDEEPESDVSNDQLDDFIDGIF